MELVKFPVVRDIFLGEMDTLLEELMTIHSVYDGLDPYVIKFRHWGMKGVLLEWIEQGMKEAPEEINKMIMDSWR